MAIRMMVVLTLTNVVSNLTPVVLAPFAPMWRVVIAAIVPTAMREIHVPPTVALTLMNVYVLPVDGMQSV